MKPLLSDQTIAEQRVVLLEAEKLYASSAFLNTDPVQFLHRVESPEDREVTGLISALFSYGNVKAIVGFLEELFRRLGPSPARSLASGKISVRGLYYRFQSTRDLDRILGRLSELAAEGFRQPAGTLFEHLFADPEETGNLRARIAHFQKHFAEGMRMSRGILHWIGSPQSVSAQKRMCMFLRWMSRTRFPDAGIYRIPPARLIVPLDVHMARMAHNLGWTKSRNAAWKDAEAVTAALRRIDPEDPLRFDFVLTRPGILGQCRSVFAPACERCAVRTACRIYAQKVLA